MDLDNKKIKEVRKIETGINNKLFWVCTIVTVTTMFLMMVNFFSRGSFLPTNIGFFYLSVVIIYSLHKEFIRWLGEKRSIRQGEYFVYSWILLTTALYIVNFFSNNYFGHAENGESISTLADVSYVTMEVLSVFVFTRIMKIFFMFRK